MGVDASCTTCGASLKTVEHTLHDCDAVTRIWHDLIPVSHKEVFVSIGLKEWLWTNIDLGRSVINGENISWDSTFATAIWWIQKWQNERVFRDSHGTTNNVAVFIMDQAKQIKRALSMKKGWDIAVCYFDRGFNQLDTIRFRLGTSVKAELWALLQGLIVAQDYGFRKPLVEVVSVVILQFLEQGLYENHPCYAMFCQYQQILA